jgi:hypothetical protein
MFTGEEHTRIRSTLPFDDLLEQVKKSLKTIGRVRMSPEGDFTIDAQRLANFAWDVKIEGWVEPRKNPDDYSIGINYQINPTTAGLILGILFFMPVGVIGLFMILNAKQEVQKRANDAIQEIEDNLDERR